MNLAIIFGKGISNEYAYYDFLLNDKSVVKSGAWFNIKIGDSTYKAHGVSQVIDWINEHKDLVREHINNSGGYKLLLNKEESIDVDSSGMEHDVYGESMLEAGMEFDAVASGGEKDKDDKEDGDGGGDED